MVEWSGVNLLYQLRAVSVHFEICFCACEVFSAEG